MGNKIVNAYCVAIAHLVMLNRVTARHVISTIFYYGISSLH